MKRHRSPASRRSCAAHQVRGPPSDGLGKTLFDAVRFYDADVHRGISGEARIQALLDEAAQNLPADHPARQLKGRQRLLAFLETNGLHHFKRLIHLQVQAQREALAAGGIVDQGRLVYMTEWAEATDLEVGRRKASLSGEPLRDVAFERLAREGQPPGVQRKYLAVAQERFPQGDTMPRTVRESVGSTLALAIETHAAELKRVLSEYRAVAEAAGRSTEAVSPAASKALLEQKAAIKRAIRALNDYVHEAEAKGATVSAPTKKAILMAEIWFRGPDEPGPTASGEGAPVDPKPPGKGPPSGRRLLATDPTFEKNLAQARSLAAEAAPVAKINAEAPAFGKERGRYTVAGNDLTADIRWSENFKGDPSKPRLPSQLSEWKGRLTPQGKPFDYKKDVKDFRSFDPVGGGIHLGDTAQGAKGRDLSLFVLRYDAAKKQLALVGPKTEDAYRLDGVEPDVLKSLYRYVLANRNAAISIGWGMARPTLLDKAADEDRSTVLLDPFLVDTRVGQDLVLADTIPWEFDRKPLSGGKLVSFHQVFKKGREEFYRDVGKGLVPILAKVKPFESAEAGKWYDRLKDDPTAHPIVLALLKHDTVEAAKPWFVEHQARRRFLLDLNAARKKQALPPVKEATDEQLKEGFAGLQQALVLKGRRLAATYEKLNKEFLAEVNDKEAPAWFGLIGKKHEAALLRAVDLSIDLQISRTGVSEVMVELWGAIFLRAMPEDERNGKIDVLANYLASRQTSLAVLLDDPTTFELIAGKIRLEGRMRYRYATTRLTRKDGRVYFGKSPGEKSEVVTIEPLTRLVNDHWSEIVDGFTPLRAGRRVRSAGGVSTLGGGGEGSGQAGRHRFQRSGECGSARSEALSDSRRDRAERAEGREEGTEGREEGTEGREKRTEGREKRTDAVRSLKPSEIRSDQVGDVSTNEEQRYLQLPHSRLSVGVGLPIVAAFDV